MQMNESLRAAPMSHPAHLPVSGKFESTVLIGLSPANIASLSLVRSVGFKEIADIRDRKFFYFEKWPCNRAR
jgi:hypothetical protein